MLVILHIFKHRLSFLGMAVLFTISFFALNACSQQGKSTGGNQHEGKDETQATQSGQKDALSQFDELVLDIFSSSGVSSVKEYKALSRKLQKLFLSQILDLVENNIQAHENLSSQAFPELQKISSTLIKQCLLESNSVDFSTQWQGVCGPWLHQMILGLQYKNSRWVLLIGSHSSRLLWLAPLFPNITQFKNKTQPLYSCIQKNPEELFQETLDTCMSSS